MSIQLEVLENLNSGHRTDKQWNWTYWKVKNKQIKMAWRMLQNSFEKSKCVISNKLYRPATIYLEEYAMED